MQNRFSLKESCGNVRPSPDHIVSDSWRNEKRGEKQKQKWQLGERERTKETQAQSAGGSVTPAGCKAPRSSPVDLSCRSSSWEIAHLQTKRKGEEQSKMETIPTQMLFIQQEILMVKSTRLIFYWINWRPALTGVLLNCWWDPELVRVLLRWSSQFGLTGPGATAATWDISLFIWNSLLETKWWETEVTRAPNVDNVSPCALWRWALLTKTFFFNFLDRN